VRPGRASGPRVAALALIAAAGLAGCATLESYEPQALREPPESHEPLPLVGEEPLDVGRYRIDVYGIGAALDHVVLVRHGEALCAFRFTRFAGSPEEVLADYEWRRLDAAAPVERGSVWDRRGIRSGAAAPPGAGERTNDHLTCGAVKLRWSYPTFVFYPVRGVLESSVELAPTKWRRFQDVDVSESRLRWIPGVRSPELELVRPEDLW
jgi:hypothetical protein